MFYDVLEKRADFGLLAKKALGYGGTALATNPLAVTGALGGAAAGAIAGGEDNRLKGALGGAVVGGLGGKALQAGMARMKPAEGAVNHFKDLQDARKVMYGEIKDMTAEGAPAAKDMFSGLKHVGKESFQKAPIGGLATGAVAGAALGGGAARIGKSDREQGKNVTYDSTGKGNPLLGMSGVMMNVGSRKTASFYDVLEKRAGQRIKGPTLRYLLGGATLGGATGRYAGDDEHKTRNMLLGAATGAVLGKGASDLHRAHIGRRLARGDAGTATTFYDKHLVPTDVEYGLGKTDLGPEALHAQHRDMGSTGVITNLEDVKHLLDNDKVKWDELPDHIRAGLTKGSVDVSSLNLGDIPDEGIKKHYTTTAGDLAKKRQKKGYLNLAGGSALGLGGALLDRHTRSED